MIEVQLVRIVLRDRVDHQLIFLRERNGSRTFPIVIGRFEAEAISRRINDRSMPRPMTHDLLQQVMDVLDGTLERVIVNNLVGGTFFAQLHVRGPHGAYKVDCRPSDAIALAVSTQSPIYVEEQVLREVCPG